MCAAPSDARGGAAPYAPGIGMADVGVCLLLTAAPYAPGIAVFFMPVYVR